MELNQKIIIKGEITARFYRQENPLLIRWNKFLDCLIKKLPSFRKDILRFYQKGSLILVDSRTNLICNAGLARWAGMLSGDITGDQVVNYMALGTGVAAPAVGDTTLGTEAYRNATASSTYLSNICYLTAFYTAAECNGTYTEFGNFINGTGAANSGYLWSHIGSISWVKDVLTTLTVDCKYTFASV